MIKTIHFLKRVPKWSPSASQSIHNNKISCLSLKYFFNNNLHQKNEEASNQEIQKINLMLKDLQLKESFDLIQTEESLLIQKLILKKKILARLQQYKEFLDKNADELNEYLEEINISCKQIIVDLQVLTKQLQDFIEESYMMHVEQRQIKKYILEFLYEAIIEHHSEERLFYKLAYILEVEIKLRSAFKHFQPSIKKQKNILNSDPILYLEAWKKVNYVTFPDGKRIQQEYKNVEKLLHAISGAVYKYPNKDESFLDSIIFSYNLIRNYLKFELGLLSSLRMLKAPNIQSTSKYLDLYQFGIYKHLATYSFPSIQTNTMIYIPLGEYQENIDIFEESKDSISVRILYYKELPLLSKNKEGNRGQEDSQINDIVIHMHGGGFVSLTSHTTQSYTRIWANQLKIPLFSIDYRMPPDYTFPTAPQDCLHVYKYLVNHIHRYLNIRPKNVYLCGDSAGGNLSCSLTALLMKNNFMAPRGLYIMYPLLDSRQIYYPSRKYIFHDPLLWAPMAEVFSNSYLRHKEDGNNPLASPLLLTEEFLGGQKGDTRFPTKWPITYVAVGGKDPLRDESIYFIQRLVESNVPCKITIFQHLRHAIFSTSKFIKESNEALQYSIRDFKEMIYKSKKDDIL